MTEKKNVKNVLNKVRDIANKKIVKFALCGLLGIGAGVVASKSETKTTKKGVIYVNTIDKEFLASIGIGTLAAAIAFSGGNKGKKDKKTADKVVDEYPNIPLTIVKKQKEM